MVHPAECTINSVLAQPILGQACSAQTPACKAGSCVNGVCTCDADQMASVSGLFCELTVQFGSNCTQSEECYGCEFVCLSVSYQSNRVP